MRRELVVYCRSEGGMAMSKICCYYGQVRLLLCSKYFICLDFQLNLKISRTLLTLNSSLDEGTVPHVPQCKKPKFEVLNIPILPIQHNR